jgi:hypothetical protein
MELNITEIDEFGDFNDFNDFDNDHIVNDNEPSREPPAFSMYEYNPIIKINNAFEKLNNKKNNFNQPKPPSQCQIKKQILSDSRNKKQQIEQLKQESRAYAQMPEDSRYSNNNLENEQSEKRVTYDDLLARMNVKMVNGRMQFVENVPIKESFTPISNLNPNQKPNAFNPNIVRQHNYNPVKTETNTSYIYNKYFNNTPKEEPTILRPTSIEEYHSMVKQLAQDRAEQQNRIRQIKSKKLIMPNSNINFADNKQNPRNMNQLFRFVGR